MKIALLGYGKMGRIIEEIAVSRGHSIVLKVDGQNAKTFTDSELQGADVAIEFTRPDAVIANMQRCFACGVPVVVGTTGWYDHLPGLTQECKTKNATLFYASNFSIGVNLFFQLNERLAELMNGFPEYDVTVEEIHHIHKLDAPSGTALTIANGLLSKMERKKTWKLYEKTAPEEVTASELPIVALRQGEVPGTHTVTYISDVDCIEITHEAFNRKGFAIGAVIAAEWAHNKKGVFTMKDLLNEQS
jgi:4-hydroxy-tetrahydrodipicolinate reductase